MCIIVGGTAVKNVGIKISSGYRNINDTVLGTWDHILGYSVCGEMTSPSPLKNLHKLVRLLGWTSPFYYAWQKQKTESVRIWLSP